VPGLKAQVGGENAKTTVYLIHLIQWRLSDDPVRQQVALVILRSAALDDEEMIGDVVAAVASNTHNDALFDEATEKLSSSESPKVAKLLSEIAVIHLRLLLPAPASPIGIWL